MKKNLKWIVLAVALTALLAVAILSQVRPTITKTAEATLTVLPRPSFNLVLGPGHIDTYPGRADAAYNASVTSINGFAGVVDFSVSGLPTGFTVTTFPSATVTLGAGETKGIQINVSVADDDALVGNYTISVSASSSNYN